MKENFSAPVRIGLCGRSGAGKGTVSELFARFGIPSIDTDKVYREMTSAAPSVDCLSPCMRELVENFSAKLLRDDFSLDRAALADIVFAPGGEESLKLLNSITHRHILSRTDELISDFVENGARAVIIDAPLLFESGYDRYCDCIVAVDAPEDVLVERIVKRDGISLDAAKRRLASQMEFRELERRADFIILNNCGKDELSLRVSAVALYILRRITD